MMLAEWRKRFHSPRIRLRRNGPSGVRDIIVLLCLFFNLHRWRRTILVPSRSPPILPGGGRGDGEAAAPLFSSNIRFGKFLYRVIGLAPRVRSGAPCAAGQQARGLGHIMFVSSNIRFGTDRLVPLLDPGTEARKIWEGVDRGRPPLIVK